MAEYTMTLEQVEKLVYDNIKSDGHWDEHGWACQLLDTMQENVRLRALLSEAVGPISERLVYVGVDQQEPLYSDLLGKIKTEIGNPKQSRGKE